jgi:hypothetical protein
MGLPAAKQPLMSVKVHHITGQKFLHTREERLAPGSHKEVEMIGQEGPGIDDLLPSPAQVGNTI